MPESTVRKSTVHFRIVGSGTFVVSHEEGESPAQVLKEARLSLADLYLHSEEFEWKIEATDDQDQEWLLRRHLAWAHENPEQWEDSSYDALVVAHAEAHGDINDLSIDPVEREQGTQVHEYTGTHVHSCSPDDASGPIDEEFYPDFLGGGRMPKYPPTLVCECGRTFVSNPCRCGRASEQFAESAG